MSFGIQTQTTVTFAEISLFAADAEESMESEGLDTSMADGRGELKTSSKCYTLSFKSLSAYTKAFNDSVDRCGTKFASQFSFSNKPSFMETITTTNRLHHRLQNGEVKQKNSLSETALKPQGKITTPASTHEKGIKGERHFLQTPSTRFTPLPSHGRKNEAPESVKTEVRQSKIEQRQEAFQAPMQRQWKKEETMKWWNARYHQKEREGGNKGDEREQHGHKEKDEKSLRVSKSTSLTTKNPTCSQENKEFLESKIKKPELTPPKIGVFALYYLLTKMGIFSDGTSHFGYKKELELVDVETTEAHKKRLEDIKTAIKKEKETSRWGVAIKVFSWIASLLGIIAGIALIATGVGAVAGALIIVGGTLQISNQIMELSGGWQKVTDLLPGDDSEKKRAVISWMQIGITVLCLILSGAGIIWGGFSNFGEAMQTAMSVIGGIAAIGHGVTTIGEGITSFFYKDKMSDIKKFDWKLAQLKHMRHDLMEKVQGGVGRLEKLFEDLAQALEFEAELFQADQMFYSR